MAITAKDVADLRAKTGLGMLECKKALEASNGDIQAAIDELRKKGLKDMDKRADRVSAEGQIFVKVAADRSKAAIVEFNTETDFTARNDGFLKAGETVLAEVYKQPAGKVEKNDAIEAAINEVRLTTKENAQYGRGHVLGSGGKVGSYRHHNGKAAAIIEVSGPISDELFTELCQHIVAITPAPIAIDESGVPADLIEKEKAIAKAQAIESGKPESIAEKMVVGKIRKFLEDNTLENQLFIKDDKKKIKDILPAGVKITGFVLYKLGGK